MMIYLFGLFVVMNMEYISNESWRMISYPLWKENNSFYYMPLSISEQLL